MKKNSLLVPIISKIYYCLVSYIEKIVDDTEAYTKEVIFKPGYTWKELYSSNGMNNFIEEDIKSSSGTLNNQELSCFIPGDMNEQRDEILKILNSKLIIRIDYDQFSKLYGSLENPVLGQKNSDNKRFGSTFKFSRQGDMCYFLVV